MFGAKLQISAVLIICKIFFLLQHVPQNFTTLMHRVTFFRYVGSIIEGIERINNNLFQNVMDVVKIIFFSFNSHLTIVLAQYGTFFVILLYIPFCA